MLVPRKDIRNVVAPCVKAPLQVFPGVGAQGAVRATQYVNRPLTASLPLECRLRTCRTRPYLILINLSVNNTQSDGSDDGLFNFIVGGDTKSLFQVGDSKVLWAYRIRDQEGRHIRTHRTLDRAAAVHRARDCW